MTKKLINRLLMLIPIYIVYRLTAYSLPVWKMWYKGINADNSSYDISLINIYTAILIFITAVIILVNIGFYFEGKFDNYFAKYIDPKLKKICDFFNRKNGGCNEAESKEPIKLSHIKRQYDNVYNNNYDKIVQLIQHKDISSDIKELLDEIQKLESIMFKQLEEMNNLYKY